ncbi:MAG: hypothetical protein H6697_09845 [Myxococcales bacterium]|nr:hypothetical protein [Myxococcales bacterium]
MTLSASAWRIALGALVGALVALLLARAGNDEPARFEAAVRWHDTIRDTADAAAHAATEAALAQVAARREREREAIEARRVQDAAAVAGERARTDAVVEQHDDAALERRMREVIERLHRLREGGP